MKESALEKYVIAEVKRRGGVTRKVTYQGRHGAPDRWMLFALRGLLIVELKKPGEKPREEQLAEMQVLRNSMQYVHWTDSKEGFDTLLRGFFTLGLIDFNERFPL